MYFDLDHVFAVETEFVEHAADGIENRARFGSHVTEHGNTCRKIGCDEAREKSVVIVENDLAERRLRRRNGRRLDPGNHGLGR